jgi:hypothetical protein
MKQDPKNRNFIEIKKRQEISYLINKYLDKTKVFIKGVANSSASLELVDHGVVNIKFNKPYPDKIMEQYEITIYTVLKRYIEITLHQISADAKNYSARYQFIKASVANEIRHDKRINITDKDINAYNFQLDKYSINPSMTNFPIAIHISFDKYKEEIIKKFENSSVEVFRDEPENRLILAVKKLQKPFYVDNITETTNVPEYEDVMKSSFNSELSSLKKQGIRSILIYPVIYTNLKNEKTTIGYFKIISFSKPILENIIDKLEEYSNAIASDIRETTYQTIKKSLKVSNISKRGVQLIINHQSTVDMFLVDCENIIFSIKLNNNILTLIGKLANLTLDKDYIYKLGLQLVNNEGHKDLKLWDEYISSLS